MGGFAFCDATSTSLHEDIQAKMPSEGRSLVRESSLAFRLVHFHVWEAAALAAQQLPVIDLRKTHAFCFGLLMHSYGIVINKLLCVAWLFPNLI